MTEPTAPVKKFQWKWVWISLTSYIVFYVLPLVIAGQGNVLHTFAGIFLGIWAFAGIIIIAAVVAYNSEGVTLWEPAIAGLLLVVLLIAYVAIHIFSSPIEHRAHLFSAITPSLILFALAFALSLFGAWFGERAQKLWKKKAPQES